MARYIVKRKGGGEVVVNADTAHVTAQGHVKFLINLGRDAVVVAFFNVEYIAEFTRVGE